MHARADRPCPPCARSWRATPLIGCRGRTVRPSGCVRTRSRRHTAIEKSHSFDHAPGVRDRGPPGSVRQQIADGLDLMAVPTAEHASRLLRRGQGSSEELEQPRRRDRPGHVRHAGRETSACGTPIARCRCRRVETVSVHVGRHAHAPGRPVNRSNIPLAGDDPLSDRCSRAYAAEPARRRSRRRTIACPTRSTRAMYSTKRVRACSASASKPSIDSTFQWRSTTGTSTWSWWREKS